LDDKHDKPMPLHRIEWKGDQSGWGLWHITETEAALGVEAEPENCPADITNPVKRTEWLAGRVLVRRLVEKAGLRYDGLTKDEFGKPWLKGYGHHVSLSHSFPYVAAQLHVARAVGIDIEQPKPKLLRIAPRILSSAEVADAGDNLVKNCVYWCAKEALYKIYGRRGLSFISHLSVEAFGLKEEGDINGRIAIANTDEHVTLQYSIFRDFVMVRTK
jgi:4'-phosphopantetheinyl transferase